MENPLCGAAFLKPETKQLAEPKPNQALIDAMTKSIDVSLQTCWSIPDWPAWRDAAHDVKAYTLANLDKLLAQFADNLEAKGVRVLWARDAEDANRIVLDIAKENGVKTVVKGKRAYFDVSSEEGQILLKKSYLLFDIVNKHNGIHSFFLSLVNNAVSAHLGVHLNLYQAFLKLVVSFSLNNKRVALLLKLSFFFKTDIKLLFVGFNVVFTLTYNLRKTHLCFLKRLIQGVSGGCHFNVTASI